MSWIGSSASIIRQVRPADTAHAFGNDAVHVLGTPALVGWLEDAALEAIKPHLQRGERTVGVAIDIEHLAPAPIGSHVTITATVAAVDGKRVTFVVTAHDAHEQLARGRHQRAVVDELRFDRRVAAKLKSPRE